MKIPSLNQLNERVDLIDADDQRSTVWACIKPLNLANREQSTHQPVVEDSVKRLSHGYVVWTRTNPCDVKKIQWRGEFLTCVSGIQRIIAQQSKTSLWTFIVCTHTDQIILDY